MSDRPDIVKGVSGQRIWFYPAEGRPTATPSVLIKDQYGSTVTAASTTYVTQDAVNTTINATSAVGSKTLTLTAVTSVEVGAVYLATNSLGQKERVKVIGVNSSSKVVHLDEPIEYAFASADTFVGTRFYRTLQSAEVASLAELYAARATYAVGGLTYTAEQRFDVVLTPLVNIMTVEWLKRYRPGIAALEQAETRGTDFEALRNEAWDNVRHGIRHNASGWRPALLRTPDDLDLWCKAELDMVLFQNGITNVLPGQWTGDAAIEYLERQVERRKAACLASLVYMDLDEDDSRSDDEIMPNAPDLVT